MKNMLSVTMITSVMLLFTISISCAASLVRQGSRVYIKDRAGELWDVTETQKRGFKPNRFQYGLGKSAIIPLGDKDLKDEQFSKTSKDEILGISVDNESHAYSIARLSYHEIANTTIAGNAIAAGY